MKLAIALVFGLSLFTAISALLGTFWLYGTPWTPNFGIAWNGGGLELLGAPGFFTCSDQC